MGVLENEQMPPSRATFSSIPAVLALGFAIAFSSVVIDLLAVVAYATIDLDVPTDFFLFFAALVHGTIIAQLTVAAAYAALGEGNHAIRIASGAVFVLVACWLLAAVAILITENDIEPVSLIFSGLIALFVFLIMQIPFWALRVARGWHLGTTSLAPEGANFRLEHVLGWSAFLVLPLLLVQFFNASGMFFSAATWYCIGFVIFHSIGFVYASNWPVITSLGLVFLISAASVVVSCFTAGVFGPSPLRTYVMVVSLVVSLTGGLYTLTLMRLLAAAGCRFSTRRSRQLLKSAGELSPPDQPTEPAPHPLD